MTEQLSLQRAKAYDQQAHEKQLKIITIRERQIKATVKYHLTPWRNGYQQNEHKQKVLRW